MEENLKEKNAEESEEKECFESEVINIKSKEKLSDVVFMQLVICILLMLIIISVSIMYPYVKDEFVNKCNDKGEVHDRFSEEVSEKVSAVKEYIAK